MRHVKLEIEKLIERLLHHYECVILPDFGGFIIRDSPCNFNVAKDKLKPYGKHIFFNPHLLQNDGLLYNEIQKNHQVSYQEAIESYQSWLFEIKHAIAEGGSKTFGHLGTFYKGNENNVWFSPLSTLNLAMDSYGLFPIDVKTIGKEETVTILHGEPVEIELEEHVYTLAHNKPIETFEPHRLNYKAWLIAASIALIAHIGYLSFEKSDVTVNEASVLPVIENKTNPFDSIEIADSTSVDENQPEVIESTTSSAPETNTATESITPETPVQKDIQVQPETKTPETVMVETPKKEEVLTETLNPVVTETPLNKVAKYRLESNANYHRNDLAKKGIKAEVRQNGDWFEVLTEENIQ